VAHLKPAFEQALDRLIARLRPGFTLKSVSRLGGDEPLAGEATEKGIGYGVSLRAVAAGPGGEEQSFVFHTAGANDFDHDRRADRAELAVLAYDTFGGIPGHVRPLDFGAISSDGDLISLAGSGEFYLLTDFIPGAVYAEDLRRIAAERTLTDRDRARTEALARYLVSLHSQKGDRPPAYTRSVRNMVGDGEGVFGLIDNYPPDVEGAPAARLQAIEARCVEWRWKLRGRENRLSHTHGDFHPFNILFDQDDRLGLLDASRGCQGDPADDVTCLAINYVFFALGREGAWPALGELWRSFWRLYLEESGDPGVLEAAPPFFAWRALVLANPLWYPEAGPSVRDRLLGLAERTLAQERLAPGDAEELFD